MVGANDDSERLEMAYALPCGCDGLAWVPDGGGVLCWWSGKEEEGEGEKEEEGEGEEGGRDVGEKARRGGGGGRGFVRGTLRQ